MLSLLTISFLISIVHLSNAQFRQKYNGDCRRHRQEVLSQIKVWVPECDDAGRYRPMQCRPGAAANGVKQCQCFSPRGDVLTAFPNNGYGNVVSCNCYFETDYYRNRERQEYQSGVTYGNMYYGNQRRSSNQQNMNNNNNNNNNQNEIVGRNFYELGWQPERQPVCQPDGRYQNRRRCSADGFCWCIDEYGLVKSDRRRDRNLTC